MKKTLTVFFTFILLLNFFCCFSQQQETDSLRAFLKKANQSRTSAHGDNELAATDTNYINALNDLAWKLRKTNNDTAILLSSQALELTYKLFRTKETAQLYEKIKAEHIARSSLQLGIFYFFKDSNRLSHEYYLTSLKIYKSLGDKNKIAVNLKHIGNLYLVQGYYPKALENYLNALKLVEESTNKQLQAELLGNIGIVYRRLENFQKALDYYFRTMRLMETLGNKTGIATGLGNIGVVYADQNNYHQALNYYFKALEMFESLENKSGVVNNLMNIGVVYKELATEATKKKENIKADSLFNNALVYYSKALKMAEEINNKNLIANTLGHTGSLYISLHNYKEAEKYIQRALLISIEINSLNAIKDHHQLLSELYENTNQPAKALEHYVQYTAIKDSIFNEENTKKTVRSEMNFEFEKKQAIEKAEQEKQNAIAQEEKQKQKIILIFVLCFLLLVVVFSAFMFNRWRITQKQKGIIEKQKEKIIDSINYAQFIQESILIDETEIQKHIPHSFIYFQPKDIVSGDFYWFSRIVGSLESGVRREEDASPVTLTHNSEPRTKDSELLIIAAIDCTGHGVPGAFMSMIGNTLLNQIVNEKHITVPSEILYHLNLGIYRALHQKKGKHLSRDGMDIALCCIDYKNQVLQYAGAQNPLYVLKNNDLQIIAANKQSIGGGLSLKPKDPLLAEFTNHTITIEKGMSIYLFSDGYKDQFDSDNKQKFGSQRFKDLIINNKDVDMRDQKALFADTFTSWKGNTSQTDDVLVIGIDF